LAIKNMGGKAKRPGGLCSTTLSHADCPRLNSSSSTRSGLDKAPRRFAQRAGSALYGHKHRNLLAHAPDRLHEKSRRLHRHEFTPKRSKEIEAKRKVFIRKWRLKCRAVPTAWRSSDRLLPSRASRKPMESIRTTNAIDACMRVQAADQRRKPSCRAPKPRHAVLGVAASGQIAMRKVDGWPTLSEKPLLRSLTSPHDPITSNRWRSPQANSNTNCDATSA